QSILRVAIHAEAEGAALSVRSVPHDHDAPITVARLAGWVRERLRRDPWVRPWAEGACAQISAELVKIRRAGGYFELRAHLNRLPSADALFDWLVRLRAGHDHH